MSIPPIRRYKVLTDGTGRFAAGLTLGILYFTPDGDGWRFFPHFQAQPSRRGWPTPEAALKGRVTHYTLEAFPYTEALQQEAA